MNNDFIDGFFKVAIDNGLSADDAVTLYKRAQQDPNAAAAMQAGISTPGPEQLGQGQPPLPTDPSGGAGVPPEIEQLIQSLPPEVLQQLIAEIEQQMGGAGDPNSQGQPPQGMEQGHPAHAGHAPEKQGSDTSLLCKTAEYKEGFLEEAKNYGLTHNQAMNFYKSAVSQMEQAPIDPALLLNTQEKQAQHYEGFIRTALDYGCTMKQAQDEYNKLFVNK